MGGGGDSRGIRRRGELGRRRLRLITRRLSGAGPEAAALRRGPRRAAEREARLRASRRAGGRTEENVVDARILDRAEQRRDLFASAAQDGEGEGLGHRGARRSLPESRSRRGLGQLGAGHALDGLRDRQSGLQPNRGLASRAGPRTHNQPSQQMARPNWVGLLRRAARASVAGARDADPSRFCRSRSRAVVRGTASPALSPSRSAPKAPLPRPSAPASAPLGAHHELAVILGVPADNDLAVRSTPNVAQKSHAVDLHVSSGIQAHRGPRCKRCRAHCASEASAARCSGGHGRGWRAGHLEQQSRGCRRTRQARPVRRRGVRVMVARDWLGLAFVV